MSSSVVASGLIQRFNEAELVGDAGVHIARTITSLLDEKNELVSLALALCVQAAELGSACLPFTSISDMNELLTLRFSEEEEDEEVAKLRAHLNWPSLEDWIEALHSSPNVAFSRNQLANDQPMRMIEGNLYLERNWIAQQSVTKTILSRLSQTPPTIDPQAVREVLDAIIEANVDVDEKLKQASRIQLRAVEQAIYNWTSVIAGGPGTGKTHTVTRLLEALAATSPKPMYIGMAALSGKAAARLNESLAADSRYSTFATKLRLDRAVTLHRLLGARGVMGGFTFNANNFLPYDVVIIDEVSMVSLPMMAHLLEAIHPHTRLILIGDPDQLTSIDVGTVLADIVDAKMPVNISANKPLVSELSVNVRNAGPISQLAEAIRLGQGEESLEILTSSENLEFIDTDAQLYRIQDDEALVEDIVHAGQEMLTCATNGDYSKALRALDSHRILCAHAHGPYGASGWAHHVENLLHSFVEGWGIGEGEWYPGRPILVTANLPDIEVYNGDTGVLVAKDQRLKAAIGTPNTYRLLNPYALEKYQTMHALTVHKSQGSQYEKVTLVLPQNSPILTRELLYTAVTRAKKALRVIGTAQSWLSAIDNPARRASGLTNELKRGLEGLRTN